MRIPISNGEVPVKTLKALGALLDYPQQPLIEALPELQEALEAEGLLKSKHRAGLERLIDQLKGGELMVLQERYVDLFDRMRSLSLHLFEHVHGETRDRGQAMVELGALYARHGYALASNELPDYLPALLEFLSKRPFNEAAEMLADAAHILEVIATRLDRRQSAYAAPFHALVALSGAAVGPIVLDEAELRRESDPAELDRVWGEAPAFGPAAGCGAGSRGREPAAVVTFHKGPAA